MESTGEILIACSNDMNVDLHESDKGVGGGAVCTNITAGSLTRSRLCRTFRCLGTILGLVLPLAGSTDMPVRAPTRVGACSLIPKDAHVRCCWAAPSTLVPGCCGSNRHWWVEISQGTLSTGVVTLPAQGAKLLADRES